MSDVLVNPTIYSQLSKLWSHRCAHCDFPVLNGNESPIAADMKIAAHHAVCPKRPVEVGDWVRWEFHRFGAWCEGELESVSDHLFWVRYGVRVSVCSDEKPWTNFPKLKRGAVTYYGVGPGDPDSSIRRIPRPGEAAQDSSHAVDPLEHAMRKRMEHLTAPMPKRVARYGQIEPHTPDCTYFDGVDAACSCDPELSDVVEAARGTTVETPWVKVPQKVTSTKYSRGPITVTRAQIVEATEYDGITGAECLKRFIQRVHQADITGTATALTPAQLSAARELWSLQLRAKVKESAERERNRVVVDLQEDE